MATAKHTAPTEAPDDFDGLYDRLCSALADNEPAKGLLRKLVDIGFESATTTAPAVMSAADNVTPIRDWHEEARERIDGLNAAISNLASDDLAPGYRMPVQTVVDLRRICRLLDEAMELLDAAVERDDAPYNEYCDEAQGIEL